MAELTARQVVAGVAAAKQALETAIAESGATETTPAGDGWTLKEMLAHVAFWEEAVIGWVTLGIRQQALPGEWRFGSGYLPEADWPHFEVHNAREAAWGRTQAMEAVVERWERAHAALLDFLAAVTPEELAAHEAYFKECPAHMIEHRDDLLRQMEGAGSPG